MVTLLVVLAALVALIQSQHGRPLGVDVWGHRWALQHRSRPWTGLAVAVTTTGAGPVAYLLAAGAGAVRAGWARSRWWRGCGLAVFALLAAQAVRLAIATWIGCRRPPAADWAWHAGGPAVPSGHTTTSAVVAAMLIAALASASRARTRRVWQTVAVVWAVGVGASRVYLGVHWPTDVLAGWLLAAALVLLATGTPASTWGRRVGTAVPGAAGPRASADPRLRRHGQSG